MAPCFSTAEIKESALWKVGSKHASNALIIRNRVVTPRFSHLVLRHAWRQKAFHPSQPMFIQLIHVVPETSDVLIELYCCRPPCFAVEYVVVSIIIVNGFIVFVFADFESCRSVHCAVDKRRLGTILLYFFISVPWENQHLFDISLRGFPSTVLLLKTLTWNYLDADHLCLKRNFNEKCH